MNLIDLFIRKDRALEVPADTRHGKVLWGDRAWRSLTCPAKRAQPLRVQGFAPTHPVWSQPDSFGWYARCADGRMKLEVTIEQGGQTLSRAVLGCGPAPAPVPIPWPMDITLGPEAALVLRPVQYEPDSPDTNETEANLEILVHRLLDRQTLYDLAKGTGVEIGPGPSPQIKPASDVEVTYIEEMPHDRWVELYDSKGKFGADKADWSQIQIGKASALPSPDGSLDFIFSSHVFEHLANPLGHLEHWKAKLKPGGRVLMIVPELSATKDRFMRPTQRKQVVREYNAKIWEPQLSHYKRNAMRLNGQKKDPIKAKQQMDRQESIHVHFYDRSAMAELMELAISELGYSAFRLIWSQNHKDFYVVITN